MKISEKSGFEFFFAPLRLCARWILAKAQSRKVQITMAPLLLPVISLSAVLAHSYRSYAKIVDARLAHGYLTTPAGIYPAPRTLHAGQQLSPDLLASALRIPGYAAIDHA